MAGVCIHSGSKRVAELGDANGKGEITMDECKTLKELIDKLGDASPLLDDKVAEILRQHQDLMTGSPPSYQLGRLAAIAILDTFASMIFATLTPR